MAKVTLNVNLFPCTREVPSGAIDLTQDFPLAKRLAKAATQLFWLRKGTAHFSGYTLDGDDGLTIQLCHEGRLYRMACFPEISFTGVLFVDVTGSLLREAIACDILGDLYRAEDIRTGNGESATGVSHLRFSVQGPDTIPRNLGAYNYRGPNRRTRKHMNREAIIARLIRYLENGD